MENATMLYMSPGEHLVDGISYNYLIVDEPEVEAKVAEGWSLTVAAAGQLAQERASALQANEDEQARIAAELEAAGKKAKKAGG